jgi:hypothetical protein
MNTTHAISSEHSVQSRREPVIYRAPNTSPLLSVEMQQTRQMRAVAIPAISMETEPARQTPAIGVPIIPKGVNHLPHRPSFLLESPSVSSVRECAEKMGDLGVHAIFRALPVAKKPDVLNQMGRRERIVLLLLDGKRTVHHVARLVHRSDLDVARTLVHLLKQRYIEYIGA